MTRTSDDLLRRHMVVKVLCSYGWLALIRVLEIGEGWQVTSPSRHSSASFCENDGPNSLVGTKKRAFFALTTCTEQTRDGRRNAHCTAEFVVFAFSPLLQNTLTISAEDRRDGRRKAGKQS
jgi:hypothetical protein